MREELARPFMYIAEQFRRLRRSTLADLVPLASSGSPPSWPSRLQAAFHLTGTKPTAPLEARATLPGILDLPAELRVRIYHYATENVAPVRVFVDETTYLDDGFHIGDCQEAKRALGLLQVSKLFCREASKEVWANLRFDLYVISRYEEPVDLSASAPSRKVYVHQVRKATELAEQVRIRFSKNKMHYEHYANGFFGALWVDMCRDLVAKKNLKSLTFDCAVPCDRSSRQTGHLEPRLLHSLGHLFRPA